MSKELLYDNTDGFHDTDTYMLIKPNLVEDIPQWMKVLTWIVTASVIVFTGFNYSFEIYELSINATGSSCLPIYVINDFIETFYLLFVFCAILVQLIVIARNNNWFCQARFHHYTMLMVMIISSFVDIAYYVIHFVSITTSTRATFISHLLATIAELLFGIVILPFVIVCVCYNLGSEHRKMKAGIRMTMLLAMSGCLVIFVRRVCQTIKNDSGDHCPIVKEYEFIHKTMESAARLLVFVDITYFMIGFVFFLEVLLNPLTENTEEVEDTPSNKFLANLSIVKYRWPTVIFSIIVFMVFFVGSYIINQIVNSGLKLSYINNCEVIFLSYILGIYSVGILCCFVYYFSDHSAWPLRNEGYTKNDDYFNKISSIIQIMYACAMFVFYIWTLQGQLILITEQMQLVVFIFLVIQVVTQAWYINSVIHRKVTNYDKPYWKYFLFPPVAMATLNFAFLMHNILYLQSGISKPNVNSTYLLIYTILNDVVAPIAMINRLHGMSFFIKLSIAQWNN